MKSKVLFFVFCFMIVIPLSTSVSLAQKSVAEVVVGNISAMTGPTSGTHMMCLSGAKDYLYYLNEKTGGISGKKGQVKVKYVAYDSQYVATKAKDGFSRLQGQGMIVTTHCASGHSDALMVDYEQAKIPLVTGSLGIASAWSDWAYGNCHAGVVNLMYGPGSKGTSITVTPTFQHGGFFVRGDLSYVHVSDIAPGMAFGQSGNLKSQPRAIAEFGFMFGNNIVEKKP